MFHVKHLLGGVGGEAPFFCRRPKNWLFDPTEQMFDRRLDTEQMFGPNGCSITGRQNERYIERTDVRIVRSHRFRSIVSTFAPFVIVRHVRIVRTIDRLSMVASVRDVEHVCASLSSAPLLAPHSKESPDMGTLTRIDPQWIKNDGTDIVPVVTVRTCPVTIIARICEIVDTAVQTVDCDDMDHAHDVARAIAYRVLARADIERRSLHSFWHGNITTGDESRHAVAPDVHERVRASVKVRRSNSGREDREVTRHGRAYVIGRADVAPNREHSMSAERARRMLEDTPRATVGHDAISVYRATQALYGDSIPDLIGADVLAFHEFRSWDEVQSRTPLKGPGTRYRLTTVRARIGEAPTVDIGADGLTVTGLLAPSADTDHVFIGHRLIVRPVTVRDARALRARSVDDALLIRPNDDIAHILASIADSATGPYRATWTVIDEHGRETATRGALSVTARGAMSVTGIAGTRQVKARTVHGLRNALARALSL